MLYRPLGHTGYQISQLGFGAMHLPMAGTSSESPVNRELAVPLIRRAFDLGVNYIDTAVGYCNQDSQRAVGEALKGYRERIVVSTKNPDYGEDEKTWWTNLENSLERLQVEYIDIYQPPWHQLEALHRSRRVAHQQVDGEGEGPGADQAHLLLVPR